MLILSRHNDESILIGDNVTVRVIEVVGNQVRLGIEAPSDVSIHRDEVYAAIKRENARSAQLTPVDVADSAPPPGPRLAG